MRGSRISCRYRFVGSVIATGALLGATEAASCGDLGPPAGAVAPTMKALDEVEPRIPINNANTPGDADTVYIIDSPGSYYLTKRLVGPDGYDGIEVTAPGVTIDLNGFDMLGLAGSGTGVLFGSNARGGVVRNGNIQLWDGVGVLMNGVGGVVERVRVQGVTNGIVLTGGTISGCTAIGCAGHGLWGVADATIIDSVAIGCGGHGIVFGSNVVISRCVSSGNSMRGFYGGTGTLTDCSARDNQWNGYEVEDGCVVRGCTSQGNLSGYLVGRGCLIESCVSSADRGAGIYAGAEGSEYTTIRGCVIDRSGSYGIWITTGCVVQDCTISNAEKAAIEISENATDAVVRRCRLTSNEGWGIRVRDRCLIEENHIAGNGATVAPVFAGILVIGDDNVMRGNVAIGNDLGTSDLGADNVWVDNIVQNNVPLP